MLRFISFLFYVISPIVAFAQANDQKPILGKTRGNWPYLEYGLGQDRLGGAKMGYLDTGIVVRVVDSTINNYRVQLSTQHFAFLDRDFFKKDTTITPRPYYLSSSWIVEGDEKYDYVKLTLDEKLPYRSLHQINPSRLIVDVFGLTSNTNWINQRSTAKAIRNVSYEQIEDDVYRMVIDLKDPQHWGHAIYYEGTRLVIRIKRQPEILDIDKLKIAVDAGHGGSNSGAAGVTSRVLEKHYTLMMARELRKELQDKGATVFMTREDDISLGMNDRLTMLRNEDPDLLLSIHLNSSSRDSIKGVSTYYRYIGFRPVTLFILNKMLEIPGLVEFGNIGSFNFTLSGPTEYVNCLVEVAFLSNREDEKLILNPAFHKEVAEKIVEGVKEWLKYCRSQSSGGKGSP
jgi:N-acetylmuramoyl-L-alanine amidase